MKNPYCLHLDLGVPLLRPEFKLEEINTKLYHNKFHINDVISSELHKLLWSLDLVADLEIEMFYSHPKKFSIIHIDITHGDYPKLNYVVGGQSSVMNWYKPIISKDSIDVSLDNRMYISYNPSEVSLVHSESIGLGHFSIVQTGVPHNVTNFEEERHCFGIVFVNKKTRIRPTMAEAHEIFSNYIKKD